MTSHDDSKPRDSQTVTAHHIWNVSCFQFIQYLKDFHKQIQLFTTGQAVKKEFEEKKTNELANELTNGKNINTKNYFKIV